MEEIMRYDLEEKRQGISCRPLVLMMALLAALCVFCVMDAADAYAYTTTWTSGGCTLTFESTTGELSIAKTTDGNGRMADFTVDETNNYRDASWYGSRESITKLTIEDGVTHIGSYAFYNYSNLTTLNIKSDSTSLDIGDYAFSKAGLSGELTFNASTTVGEGTFSSNTALTSVTYKQTDDITIGKNAFSGCTGLKSLTFPSTAQDVTIAEYAFNGCTGLTAVSLPSTADVVTIGSNAFAGCTKLATVTMPTSATSITIGSSAFANDDALKSLSFPYTSVNIANGAFAGTSLATLTLYDTASINASALDSSSTTVINVKYSGSSATKSIKGGSSAKVRYETQFTTAQNELEQTTDMLNYSYDSTTKGGVVTISPTNAYDAGGSATSVVKQEEGTTYVDTGKTVTFYTYPMTGYSFVGWYKIDEKTGEESSSAASTATTFTTTVSGTEKYVARFSRTVLSVNFGLLSADAAFPDGTYKTYTSATNNVSTVKLLASTTAAINTISVPDPTYSSNQYEFLGWSTRSGQTTPTYAKGTGGVSGYTEVTNLANGSTLYAVWKATVKYDANFPDGVADERLDKTAPADVTFIYQASTNSKTSLADCTYSAKGYSFAGWYTKADSTGVQVKNLAGAVNATNNAGVITLYAHWDKVTYTVDFDINAGNAVMTDGQGNTVEDKNLLDVSFTYDDTDIMLLLNTEEGYRENKKSNVTISRSGYTFLGWSINKSETATTFTPNNTIAGGYEIDGLIAKGGDVFDYVDEDGNLTLYAVWLKGMYSIVLDPNGGYFTSPGAISGGGAVTDPATFKEGFSTTGTIDLTGDAASVARENYFFMGWAVSKDDAELMNVRYKENGAVQGADIARMVDENKTVTLYAVWKPARVNVIINATDGVLPTETTDVAITVLKDLKATYTYSSTSIANVTGYRESDKTIVFTNEDIQAIASVAKPTKDGYEFIGYGLTKDALEPMTSLIAESGVTDIEIYALWKPIGQVTLSFNAMKAENGVDVDPITVTIGDTVKLPDCTWERKGYYASGWATSEANAKAGTVEYKTGESYTIETDHTLYVVWMPLSCDVYFNIQYPAKVDGIKPSSTAHQSVTYSQAESGNSYVAGADVIEVTYYDLTRTGYVFKGWSFQKDRSSLDYAKGTRTYYGTDIFDDTYAKENANGNFQVTLYDVWEAIDQTISFDFNGGLIGESSTYSVNVAYDQTFDLSTINPKKASSIITGWADSKENAKAGVELYSANATFTVTGSIKLYAIWSTSFEITFAAQKNADGYEPGFIVANTKRVRDENGYSLYVKNGQDLSALSQGIMAVPENGYYFVGWKWEYLTDEVDATWVTGSGYQNSYLAVEQSYYDAKKYEDIVYGDMVDEKLYYKTGKGFAFQTDGSNIYGLTLGEDVQIIGLRLTAVFSNEGYSVSVEPDKNAKIYVSTGSLANADALSGATGGSTAATLSYTCNDTVYLRVEATSPTEIGLSEIKIDGKTYNFANINAGEKTWTTDAAGTKYLAVWYGTLADIISSDKVYDESYTAEKGGHTIVAGSVTAVPQYFKVTISGGEGGTVALEEAEGVLLSADKKSADVAESVNATIAANTGYFIKSIKVNGNAASYTAGSTSTVITLTEASTVKVTFEKIPTDITVTLLASGKYGSVTIYGKDAEDDSDVTLESVESSDVSKTFDSGQTVRIKGNPKSGYRVVGMSINGTSVYLDGDSYYDLELTENVTVEVVFKPSDYYVIRSEYNSEKGYVSFEEVYVQRGQDFAFEITPEIGYKISSVELNGTSDGTDTKHTITTVRKDYLVEVTFKTDSKTYKITGSVEGGGGTVDISRTSAIAGQESTATITPDSGYHISRVIVDGVDKGAITKYVFTGITSNHTVVATFASNSGSSSGWSGQYGVSNDDGGSTMTSGTFTDVSSGDWYYAAVKYAYENNLLSATGTKTFSPNTNASRATIISMIYNNEGQPSTSTSSGYTDVSGSSWYASAVSWGTRKGIITGTTSLTFSPNGEVTREQLASMLYRYAQYKGADVTNTVATNIKKYSDSSRISAYALDAMCWACNNNLLTGKSDSQIDPQGYATRAEVAAMMMRLNNNLL